MLDTAKFAPINGDLSFIHHADDAPAYWVQGILWVMLADRDDTGGRWSMSSPSPHPGTQSGAKISNVSDQG